MKNSLIDRLREAKTLADADPILRQLGADGVFRKLVEASILQRMNPNPASYEYGVSMLNEAIQSLDKDEEPAAPETPGVKVKNDKFVVKEETLTNHNPKGGQAGSEQSTENTEPYTGEGTKQGDEDMTSAPNTENQMSETGDDAPFPNNLSEMDGLHPDIAKQMGAKMPTVPPMNAGDQMKQTRYTIQKYHETIVKPLLAHSKKQDAAIYKLSQKIRETEARAGTYTLDMDVLKNNAPTRMKETTAVGTIPVNPLEQVAATRIQNKDFDLTQTRNKIRTMNNHMSS